MVKGHGKEMNNQRGSATIEAVIGFTAFLFAIFTILGLVNFCRAQMLVSSAVDTAAKEMSQYAYFYQMSGLQKFEEQLDDNASVGKNNINEIIGTVDTLYSSINGAVDQTIQEKTNVQNMLAAGDADLQTFENAITGIENSAEGVMQGITGVGNALKDVGNDPLLYMRSLVALIGSEGMEAAKRAVAVPLARSFVAKHFGEDTDAANAKLESLGIEGGLDSMNFNLSNIFSDDKHQDIEITVIYKVKLFQVFDWVILEANVSKVASCRAWLGGDDVIVKAVSSEQPPLGTETPSTEEDNNETTDSTDPTEGNNEESGSNASTGNWALQHDPTGYNGSEREGKFADQFYSDYRVDTYEGNYSYRTSSDPTMAYTYAVHHKWTYGPDETALGAYDPGVDMLENELLISINSMSENGSENNNGEQQQFAGITKVVYVPENIPDDQYSDLLRDATNTEAKMKEHATDKGLSENFQVKIVVVKGGGTYDYSSSENDYVNIGGEE